MARLAPHTVVLHGHELSYVDSGTGPAVLFIHGILGLAAPVVPPRRRGRRRPPGPRARPLRARRLRQADGRLLAQLARRDPARPARPPRHRTGHPGGALARRRDRDAVLLPLPRPGGPPRARRRAAASGGRSTWSCARPPCPAPSRCSASSPPLPSCERVEALGRGAQKMGWKPGADIGAIWRGFTSLGDRESRRAFLATTRAVIDIGGQSISAHDHLGAVAPSRP